MRTTAINDTEPLMQHERELIAWLACLQVGDSVTVYDDMGSHLSSPRGPYRVEKVSADGFIRVRGQKYDPRKGAAGIAVIRPVVWFPVRP